MYAITTLLCTIALVYTPALISSNRAPATPIAGQNKRGNPENYRDTWPEPALLEEADQDFEQQLRAMENAVAVC